MVVRLGENRHFHNCRWEWNLAISIKVNKAYIRLVLAAMILQSRPIDRCTYVCRDQYEPVTVALVT